MGKVILDMSMSLDGFIVGALEKPERLHDWMFPPSGGVNPVNADVIDDGIKSFGAIIMGKRSYEAGVEYDGYADDPYDAVNIVLTHHIPDALPKGNTRFIFITDGVARALEQAQAAAGDRDIAIGGGANTAQQFLKAGLVDEVYLHVVPVLLGEGMRLFDAIGTDRIELEPITVINTPEVIHLRYRVVNNAAIPNG